MVAMIGVAEVATGMAEEEVATGRAVVVDTKAATRTGEVETVKEVMAAEADIVMTGAVIMVEVEVAGAIPGVIEGVVAEALEEVTTKGNKGPHKWHRAQMCPFMLITSG